MTDNERLPPGLRVSEEERQVIAGILERFGTTAKEQGHTKLYTTLHRFVIKLNQSTFAGEGVPDKTMRELAAVVEDGLAKGDSEQARRGLSSMLQAVIRMEPDPARAIAEHLAPGLLHMTRVSAAQQQGFIGALVLKKFKKRIEEDLASWGEQPMTADYILGELTLCAAELNGGSDPFKEE